MAKLTITFDQDSMEELLFAEELLQLHKGPVPQFVSWLPATLLIIISTVRPDLAKKYKIPYGKILKGNKDQKLPPFNFDAEGDIQSV